VGSGLHRHHRSRSPMQRIGLLTQRKMGPAIPLASKTVCFPGTVILQVGFYDLHPLFLPIESRLPLVHNIVPTYEHASSFHRQPGPPPSGSISHHQSFPERYASINSPSPPLPMMQHAATMPYDMSRHPPSRSEMSGGPQPSSQSWSYRAYAVYISLV
jgi:hypothetical protein